MAGFFKQQGMRAVAVHSGPSSANRAQSLDELSAGHLDVICAVDVFNQGLDLPELDTVLMLRPTESRILWLQQFGRGLRKTAGDKELTDLPPRAERRLEGGVALVVEAEHLQDLVPLQEAAVLD
jgi:superfamily II DNA or RNA helicase